jgi:hypothetical protein
MDFDNIVGKVLMKSHFLDLLELLNNIAEIPT